MEVLRTNHQEACAPTVTSLDSYPECPPELVPLNIIDNMVTAVAGQLLGLAGPKGMDSVILQHWLLRFGGASCELRLIVSGFTEWLSDWRPPRAVYRAMMTGRLIALDKQPGIRMVGVGETWRRIMAKCLLCRRQRPPAGQTNWLGEWKLG